MAACGISNSQLLFSVDCGASPCNAVYCLRAHSQILVQSRSVCVPAGKLLLVIGQDTALWYLGRSGGALRKCLATVSLLAYVLQWNCSLQHQVMQEFRIEDRCGLLTLKPGNM